MALSYNLGYQESISVHPTRRQIFASKPDSTFPNIWQWLIFNTSEWFGLKELNLVWWGIIAHSALHPQLGQLYRLQLGEGGENPRNGKFLHRWFLSTKKVRPNDVLVLDLGLHNDSPQVTNTRDTIKNLLRQEVGAVWNPSKYVVFC